MFHCPYCGTQVNEDETYCINCGKFLPDDFESRVHKKTKDKFWFLPIGILLMMLIVLASTYFIAQHKTYTAKQLYEQGAAKVEQKQYQSASQSFSNALDYQPAFNEATIAHAFSVEAMEVQKDIKHSREAAHSKDFQKALTLVNETEQRLDDFSGDAVGYVIDTVSDERDSIKTIQLEQKLKEDPSIDKLKTLLWDAEEIDNNQAEQMANDIREQIIDYTFTRASEQTNHHHFTAAKVIVEDGLKYAPESEKLTSLDNTIQNEQEAFETTQEERINQALNTAVEEQESNENDAIELVKVSLKDDEQGNLLVEGTIKSTATIPVNTISIKYALTSKEGKTFSTHHVYAYPDTLYPDEKGQFEFSHFDIKNKSDEMRVKVEAIKWYTK